MSNIITQTSIAPGGGGSFNVDLILTGPGESLTQQAFSLEVSIDQNGNVLTGV